MIKNIPWIKDEVSPDVRTWEEFYRNRWQYDKIVRSTHGANCTGSCSWNVYVKDGIVTWEMQAVDHPKLTTDLPPYEPRGCQRGISASWYLYSPLRVKYPYIRGALLDLWRKAKAEHSDPVDAWTSLVENPESRKRWQRARGKGGFQKVKLGRSAGAYGQCQYSHHQKTWAGPYYRFLAYPGNVHDQLCSGVQDAAAHGWNESLLL